MLSGLQGLGPLPRRTRLPLTCNVGQANKTPAHMTSCEAFAEAQVRIRMYGNACSTTVVPYETAQRWQLCVAMPPASSFRN